MKREMIERHLRQNENATAPHKRVNDAIIELLDRERERLTKELAELDAKEVKAPGFTDSEGDRFDFVEHSSGKWLAIGLDIYGNGLAYGTNERDEIADALRAFLKERGL